MISELQDGFQEIYSIKEHKLPIRGYQAVRIGQETKLFTSISNTDIFISWDSKHAYTFEKGSKSTDTPRKIGSIPFPKNQKEYIQSIVYIHSLKIYFAAASDSSFKIYDTHLKLIESISHDEYYVVQMIYNKTKDSIVIATTRGISIWKVYRTQSLDRISYTIERLNNYNDHIQGWVSYITIDPSNADRVLATIEQSAYDIDLERKQVVAKLENIHDDPLCRICWYPKSQLYITGCRKGLIRLWTSHFEGMENKSSPNNQMTISSQCKTAFAQVHTFRSHYKSITGLALHTTPNILISASMDSAIKLLHIEGFYEVMSISLAYSIISLESISYGKGVGACLIATEDGSLKLWKMTCFSNSYSSIPSKIKSLHTIIDESSLSLAQNSKSEELLLVIGTHDIMGIHHSNHTTLFQLQSDIVVDGILSLAINLTFKYLYTLMEDNSLRIFDISENQKQRNQSNKNESDNNSNSNSNNNENDSYTLKQTIPLTDLVEDLGKLTCICLINNIKAAELRGDMIITDGSIDSNTNSDTLTQNVANKQSKMELLIALGSNTGNILILEWNEKHEYSVIKVFSANYTGAIHHIKYRSHRNELILFGSDSEHIISRNTHTKLEDKTTIKNRNNYETKSLVVRIWSIPTVICSHVISNLNDVTAYDISPTLGHIGIGFTNGSNRLFHLFHPSQNSLITATSIASSSTNNLSEGVEEILPNYIGMQSSMGHSKSINSITFFDHLRIYGTSSEDGTVIIYTYDRRCVRTIVLHTIPISIAFTGSVGDIAVAVENNISIIKKDVWNYDAIIAELEQRDENNSVVAIDPYHWGTKWSSNILESILRESQIQSRIMESEELDKRGSESKDIVTVSFEKKESTMVVFPIEFNQIETTKTTVEKESVSTPAFEISIDHNTIETNVFMGHQIEKQIVNRYLLRHSNEDESIRMQRESKILNFVNMTMTKIDKRIPVPRITVPHIDVKIKSKNSALEDQKDFEIIEDLKKPLPPILPSSSKGKFPRSTSIHSIVSSSLSSS